MYQPRKIYRVLKKGKQTATLFPGNYAGNKINKIFCRLDCEFNLHMDRDKRVFFANWKEATAAKYNACKKCQPLSSDIYPEHEAIKAEVLAKLHIGLWETPPTPGKPLGVWYVRLNWQDKSVKTGKFRRIRMGDSEIDKYARRMAIEWGKEYNLPVLCHGSEDSEVIRVPILRTNDTDFARDKKKIRDFLKTKKVRCFRSMFLNHFVV